MKRAYRLVLALVLFMSTAVLAAEDIVLESDVLKLVLHSQSGTYSLYRKSGKKNRFTAFTEVSDYASSTFFAIKADGKYIPLRRDYNTTISAVQNDDGSASLVFDADGTFHAEARFALLVTQKEMPADSVRVDLSVKNLSDKDAVLSMKAVIDTVLGETSRIHFTTAKGSAIRTEKAFATMTQDKWISSSDGIGTLSVLLAGSAATDPEYVLAANRDIMLSDAWKPVVNEGRSFSTLQSPNNSALGIWFSETKLKQNGTARYTFFLTTAADGDVPPNAALLGIESDPEVPELSESTVESASEIVNTAYIQQLLDRIQEIENSDNPDPEEIQELSAEIDALILKLTE